MNTEYEYKSRKNVIWGLLFILAGSLLLLDRLDIFYVDSLWHYWPLVLVVLGMNKMIDYESGKQFSSGCWMVMIGFWLYACFEHIWGLTFGNSWPVFLIACGIGELMKAVLHRGEQGHGK